MPATGHPATGRWRTPTWLHTSRGIGASSAMTSLGEQGRVKSCWASFFRIPAGLRRVEEIMRWLWEEVFSDNDSLTVPQPLGCVPELAMLLFRPLPGQPLDSALSQGGGANKELIQLCARWLAALHRSSTALDRRFNLEVEAVNLEAWAALIAHRYKDFAPASQALFRALRERTMGLRLEANAPIHKDFHYQHVFVNGTLGVIDFDEIRWGDQNCDVAHFCAHLNLLSCQRARRRRVRGARGSFPLVLCRILGLVS